MIYFQTSGDERKEAEQLCGKDKLSPMGPARPELAAASTLKGKLLGGGH